MLQKITDTISTHKWFWYTILGALALVFAAWGAYGFVNLNFGSSTYAAVANGQTISLQEARNAWLRAQTQMQQQYGGSIPAGAEKRLQDNVLEQLISNTLMAQRTESLGYEVSEGQLLQAIRSEPAFQIAGKYSPEAAKNALEEANMSLSSYESSLENDLRRRQLLDGIVASEFVTPEELARAQSLENQEREIQYAILPDKDFQSSAPISPAAIEAYYKAHAAQYTLPQSVDLRYAQLTLAQVAATVKVSEADLQAAYKKELSRFVVPEQREASHILISFGNDPAAALKEAEKVAKLARSGQSFAQLAKKYSQDPGSAQHGGNLGWLTRQAFVKPFADALFAIPKVGDIVGPVKSPYGYHIIKLDGIRPGHTRTFEEVKAQLQQQLARAQATDRFGDIEDRLQNDLENPGASLAALAKRFDMQSGEVAQFLRGTGAAPLGAARPVQNLVFGANAIAPGTIGGPVIVDNDRMVVVKVISQHGPQLKPLAEVAPGIVAMLEKQRATEAALAAARAARAKLAAGAPFAEVAKSLKVAVHPPKFIGRGDPSVPGDILDIAFDSPKPTHGPVFRATKLSGGGAALIAITRIRSGARSENPVLERTMMRDQMQRTGMGDALAYIAQVRATAKVRKNPQAFD
jgi:peptidyl-prolyl cis-trans isomerase D